MGPGRIDTHVILDISRLLWRAERFAPTGIDRVELAYARHLIAAIPHSLSFCGWWGRMSLLNYNDAVAMVAALDEVWKGETVQRNTRETLRKLTRRMRRHALLRGERPLHAHAEQLPEPVTYTLVSHYRLHRPNVLLRLQRHAHLRFVFLVHDLIPIHLPEHVPPGHDRRHRKRMETVIRLGSHVITNSEGTKSALSELLLSAGARVPITVAPLGIDFSRDEAQGQVVEQMPYFVCLSTIEPRKNHRLLFRVWSNLIAKMGERTPRLIILGRKGWGSEGILQDLRKNPRLQQFVEVHENLPDRKVAHFIRGARALLNPSLAEGFGLPVVEALSLGAPVICSDLRELREVAGDVPEFCDPLDEKVWEKVVLDYLPANASRRVNQLNRMRRWSAPSWSDHFAVTLPIIRAEDGARASAIRAKAM